MVLCTVLFCKLGHAHKGCVSLRLHSQCWPRRLSSRRGCVCGSPEDSPLQMRQNQAERGDSTAVTQKRTPVSHERRVLSTQWWGYMHKQSVWARGVRCLCYCVFALSARLQAAVRFSQLRSRRKAPPTHVTQHAVTDLALIGDFSKVGSKPKWNNMILNMKNMKFIHREF